MYKGKRRKPNDNRLTSTAIGATFIVGGAVVPMTFASSAQASTIDQWDKIAYCEADGKWNLPGGDKDSTGGLQFREASFRDALEYLRDQGIDVTNYDGPEAYKNTKGQQILAGEALLALQGPGAWAVTTDANGAAKGCTGLLADGSLFEGGPNPFGEQPLQDIADGAELAVEEPEPEPEPEPSDPPEEEPEDPAEHTDPGNVHTVVKGDTLYDIAKEHGIPGAGIDGPWANLYAANVHVVGDNPNLIFPGQKLTLDVHDARGGVPLPGEETEEPAPEPEPEPEPEPNTYTVKSGDSLSAIAKAHGLDWRKLYNANKEVIGPDPDVIAVGMVLSLDVEGAGTDVPEDEAPASSGYGSPMPGFSVTHAYRTPGDYMAGYHTGVDYAASTGTPVYSAGPGVVASVNADGGSYGTHVKIRHDDGRYTLYAHLSSESVSVGERVDGDTQIGKVGSTGNSSGPHLHFEVRRGGGGYWDHVDPIAWLNSH